jgi:hypothetical protein
VFHVLEAAIGFTEREFLLFFLVLVRMTGLFILAPLFGHASIPAQSKAGLAFACTLIVYPMAIQAPFEMPADVYELASFIARELFVGAVIGFVALLVFAAAQYGGEMIDTQIGFSLANIVDPSFGQQVSLLGQFHYLLAMMVYLAVDGHHYLIGALMRSYSVIPHQSRWQQRSPAHYLQPQLAAASLAPRAHETRAPCSRHFPQTAAKCLQIQVPARSLAPRLSLRPLELSPERSRTPCPRHDHPCLWLPLLQTWVFGRSQT